MYLIILYCHTITSNNTEYCHATTSNNEEVVSLLEFLVFHVSTVARTYSTVPLQDVIMQMAICYNGKSIWTAHLDYEQVFHAGIFI